MSNGTKKSLETINYLKNDKKTRTRDGLSSSNCGALEGAASSSAAAMEWTSLIHKITNDLINYT